MIMEEGLYVFHLREIFKGNIGLGGDSGISVNNITPTHQGSFSVDDFAGTDIVIVFLLEHGDMKEEEQQEIIQELKNYIRWEFIEVVMIGHM